MNNADKRTEKRKLGDIGENIASDFLKSRGYVVIKRNYLRKWGELDIVARKGHVMHFVEVKTVNHETPGADRGSISGIRPEENMHPGKIRRLMRTIEIYMFHEKLKCGFQLDLITVKINPVTQQAKVELFENIVI